MFSNPSPRPSGPKAIPHQTIDVESLKLPPLQRVIAPSHTSTMSSPLLHPASESTRLPFSPKGSPTVHSNGSPKIYSNGSPTIYPKEYPSASHMPSHVPSHMGSHNIPRMGSQGFPTSNTLEKDLSMGASTMELFLDGDLETYDTLRSVRILSHSPSPKSSLPAGVQQHVAETIPPDTSAETPIEDVNKEDPLALPPLEVVSRGDTMESLGLPCVLEQREEDEALLDALMKKMDQISDESKQVGESGNVVEEMDGNAELLVEDQDVESSQKKGESAVSTIRTAKSTKRRAINAADYDFSADEEIMETDRDSVMFQSHRGDSSITQLSYHSSAKQSQLYPEDYQSTESSRRDTVRRSGTDQTLPTGAAQFSTINKR